ncbi:Flp pilus assembly protein CpaB [Lentisphaerota bacterium WC36G]|nr:Flp pilus assembly protein CpaB [Lentisphaerae bacterium WC36]
MKQKLLLLIAVLLGVLAFVLTATTIQKAKEKIESQLIKVQVIELIKSISEGEKFTSDHLKAKILPVGRNYFRDTKNLPYSEVNRVIASKAAKSFSSGKIISSYDLDRETLRFDGLSTEIKSGSRAKTIAVDAIASINYMIKPKDKVDIIATFRFPDQRGNQALDTITMTLLQNVTVLATGGQRRASETQRRRVSYNTVTLQLLPSEVDMITFASQKGVLSLSLRNQEDARFEKNTQSINFKYLQENINEFNKRREERAMDGTL